MNISNLFKKPKIECVHVEQHLKIKFFLCDPYSGKKKRTYIYGLDLFIESKDVVNELCQKIRQSIGTGSNEVLDETTKKFIYGFQGDHVTKIKEILCIELKISPDKIL